MSYEEINELNRQTAEMTRRITLKWDILSILMIIVCMALIIIGIRLIWEGIRERKERMTSSDSYGATFPTGEGYQPTVTDTVQYDQFGTEFRRMGVAGRR